MGLESYNRYKFYICEFKNIRYPAPAGWVLIKFGITHHNDVLKRFDPSVDDGYLKRYDDWFITCKFSLSCDTKQEAERIEMFFINVKYPYESKYKVWVERYLGLDDLHYYSDNSGISELRLLPISEAKQLYHACNQRKNILNETRRYIKAEKSA